MATRTTEIETTSTISAPKLFKIFVTDYDTIQPKVDPAYKSIKVIQGDGGVESIKSITYDNGASHNSFKVKVDAIDPTNLISTTTVFEGDALMGGIFDTITQHIKITPSTNGGSLYKITSQYKGKDSTKMTDDIINTIKESIKKSFKDLESYALAHPEL